jgi:ethanolamine utilization protein EutA
VVSRETLFQSEVALTPYESEERIDDVALGAIIDDAYRAAQIDPKEIDTGAVILTGEALRRENASAIADLLARQGGDLVCAAAGHHMEAMLAAYGSGAARVSSDKKKRILNIDIGGGTTKLGVVENGKVTATAAVHVGGRLQVVDGDGRIVRLDPAGRWHAAEAGFDWRVGDAVRAADLDRVAEKMADSLAAAIVQRPMPQRIAHLYLTEPIADYGRIDGIMLSGGVGEYVYDRETRDFGDMGRRLGHAIRRRIEGGALPWPLLPAGECIRATALGASEYSVQLSGNTCTITNPGALLPRRNLQVVQPPYEFAEASTRRRSARRSTGISPHSTWSKENLRLRSRSAGAARPRTSACSPSPRASASACRTRSGGNIRSTSCSTATWRRRSARCCAKSSACRARFW